MYASGLWRTAYLRVSAGVPNVGKILGVGFPGFAGSDQFTHDIVG